MHQNTVQLTSVRGVKFVSHQSDCVEDVDERSQDLSVEVGRHEGADRREECDDGHAHGQVVPAVNLGTAGHHELPPEES